MLMTRKFHHSSDTHNHQHNVNNLMTSSLNMQIRGHRNKIFGTSPKFDDNNKSPDSGKMSTKEKLEKIIFELIETERAYVKDLENLIRIYLEPLQVQSYLPHNDIARLTGACLSIIRFHKIFFEELQEAVTPGSCYTNDKEWTYTTNNHLRYAILRLGGVFLNSAAKFKSYSSFCAAYLHIQKFLRLEQNSAVQKFLLSLNVWKEHSATFESYLIKPVQRILRYPLFLQQLETLTDRSRGAAENMQICEALVKMEKVAEYINEMQRIYEEYGQLFSQAHALYVSLQNKVNLEVSELLMFGELCWLNANEEINSGKKKSNAHTPLECLCFVFKSAVLLVAQQDKSKNRKSKNSDITDSSSEKFPICRIVPILELEVSGDDVSATCREQFVWIIVHNKNPVHQQERIYYLSNRRFEIKRQFLKAIRKAHALSLKSSATNQSPPIDNNTSSSANGSRDHRRTRKLSAPSLMANQKCSTILSPSSSTISSSSSTGAPPIFNGSGPHVTFRNGGPQAPGVRQRVVTYYEQPTLAAVDPDDHDHSAVYNMQISCCPQQQQPPSYRSSQSDPGYGSNGEQPMKIV